MPENQFYQSYKQIPSLVKNGKCIYCKTEIVKLERKENQYSVIELCPNKNCIRGGIDVWNLKNWRIKK